MLNCLACIMRNDEAGCYKAGPDFDATNLCEMNGPRQTAVSRKEERKEDLATDILQRTYLSQMYCCIS